MNMLSNIWFKIGAGVVIFGLAIWGLIVLYSRHPVAYATAVASRRDLTEIVTAEGTVKADQEVSLSFSQQGIVSAVQASTGEHVKAGQVLASLDSGSLQAQLAGAKADVLAAQASLSTAETGARPEELVIYEQKYADASSAFITAIKDAYLSVEDAILNKSDTVFNNGSTANPTINIRVDSQAHELSINQERASVTDALASWKSSIDSLDISSTSTGDINAAEKTADYSLSIIRSFMSDLGTIANSLSVGNSGMTLASINAAIAAVNGAAQEVTGAVTAEQAAESAWNSARDSLALERAGSTPQDIQAAQAVLAKAEAQVLSYQSELDHSYLIAPFDGTVTNVDYKIGESYVPGISAGESIGLISNGAFEVDSYVPQTDIGKISISDPVAVTFDSYGPGDVFPARVMAIDPAATMNDGANAYKVTSVFDSSDPRILSGLSANLSITVATATQAIAVPMSAIITRGLSAYALLKEATSSSFDLTPVQTGIETADGYVQILSGLSEGDIVAAFGSSYQSDQ